MSLNELIVYVETIAKQGVHRVIDLPDGLYCRRLHERAMRLGYLKPAARSMNDAHNTLLWSVNPDTLDLLDNNNCPAILRCRTFSSKSSLRKCMNWQPELRDCKAWNGRKRKTRNARKVHQLQQRNSGKRKIKRDLIEVLPV